MLYFTQAQSGPDGVRISAYLGILETMFNQVVLTSMQIWSDSELTVYIHIYLVTADIE
jgi:hypothetical protein